VQLVGAAARRVGKMAEAVQRQIGELKALLKDAEQKRFTQDFIHVITRTIRETTKYLDDLFE
jgi:hypothetical protein